MLSAYQNLNETFTTDGGPGLLEFRKSLVISSLEKAKIRLEKERLHKFKTKSCVALTHVATQVGGDRPISSCAVSADGNHVASGCWDGSIAMWKLTDLCFESRKMGAHADRVCCVSFNPDSTSLVDMVSGDASGVIKLWKKDGSESIVTGHLGRVSRAMFFSHFVCSASYDMTWRVWDINNMSWLTMQEGHAKEISALDMHPDGALVGSGGLDGNAALWDLRSGRLVATLKGHSESVFGISFSPNGHSVATASGDGTCRVFEMRKIDTVPMIIFAHASPISDVRFDPTGASLLTVAHDGTGKLWKTLDWSIGSVLAGHSSKILGCAWDSKGQLAVTASYDRTLRLWMDQNNDGRGQDFNRL